jgi:hypothetical protein
MLSLDLIEAASEPQLSLELTRLFSQRMEA